jgi:WD40 repeat protein
LSARKEVLLLPDRCPLCYAIGFDRSSKFVATGGGEGAEDVHLLDVKKGELVHVFSGHQNVVICVAFSPDGQFLASGSADDDVIIWNLRMRKKHAILKGHRGEVLSVSFSPDSKHLASASMDGTACVWETTSGKLEGTFTPHGKRILWLGPVVKPALGLG